MVSVSSNDVCNQNKVEIIQPSTHQLMESVAWATSNRLGCGITKCEDLYLIVCHYHSGYFCILFGSL
ncbi:UNVERIFIED_CONTAM: hypothetical protein NCL1_21313 [Trichonephila clavipes]